VRRTTGVITLGLLLTVFCLSVGNFKADNLPTCRRVIGTSESETQVFLCEYEDGGKYYLSSNGKVLPYVEHPFAKENLYDE
jgi:hypothetical protein